MRYVCRLHLRRHFEALTVFPRKQVIGLRIFVESLAMWRDGEFATHRVSSRSHVYTVGSQMVFEPTERFVRFLVVTKSLLLRAKRLLRSEAVRNAAEVAECAGEMALFNVRKEAGSTAAPHALDEIPEVIAVAL